MITHDTLKPIARLIMPILLVAVPAAARSTSLFTTTPESASQKAATETTTSSGFRHLTIIPSALTQILSSKSSTPTLDIPMLDGTTAEVAITEVNPFKSDAKVILRQPGNQDSTLPLPAVTYFRGTGTTNPDLSIFLAVPTVTSAPVRAMILEAGHPTSCIIPVPFLPNDEKQGASETSCQYILTAEVPAHEGIECHSDSLPIPDQAKAGHTTVVKSHITTAPLLEVEIDIDVGKSMVDNRFPGDPAAAAAYSAQVLAASSEIMERDLGVRLAVSNIVVWTTPEPFANASTLTALMNYEAYCNTNRTGSTYDLAHYVYGGTSAAQGIAYIQALCGSQRYGLSRIRGNYTYPTAAFTVDVMIMAHELGHNLGSTHTHCYTPPIDMCYSGEASCYAGATVPQLGTLMSYCHMSNGLGRVGLELHPRCVDLMRPYIAGTSCVAVTPVHLSGFQVD